MSVNQVVSVNQVNIVDRFCEVYAALNANNVDSIEEIYGQDIVFIDPLHRIEGLSALKSYMGNMYENVSSYSVEVKETMQQQGLAFVHWDLTFCHPKLNRGEAIQFAGITRLEFQEKIVCHQDFFDAGAMLYEHIPVLGFATRWIKQRAGI